MSFDDQFARSQAALHSQCADKLLYVPDPDGTGEMSNSVAIENAIIGEETETDEPHDMAPSGYRKVRRREVSIITDAAREGFSGVETIEKTATVELGDWVYSIEDVRRSSGGGSTLSLIREAARDLTRGGYRK